MRCSTPTEHGSQTSQPEAACRLSITHKSLAT
jgi:hypothetical protein